MLRNAIVAFAADDAKPSIRVSTRMSGVEIQDSELVAGDPVVCGAPTALGRSPRGGRPRDPDVNRRILEATVELLAAVGLEALTIEGIAARAGVAKTTIYRRWSSKKALLLAALEVLSGAIVVPDRGNVEADLKAYAQGIIERLYDTATGLSLLMLVSETATNPALASGFRAFISRRHEDAKQMLVRGIARGEVREDVDIDAVLDLLSGSIIYRVYISHGPVTSSLVDDVVGLMMRGIRKRSA
jgi:AcrR family transcriptional regulator